MDNKIRTVIIDDENLARKIVKAYLKNYSDIEIIAECTNGFEGIKVINEQRPDMIFLDIQMPKLTGFEMLELLDKPPVIIFTTAYDQYALKAFEVNAVDYLLKPFSEDRFKEAIDKAILHIGDKTSQKEKIEKIIQHFDDNIEYLERITNKSGSKISIIPIDKVQWIEAQDDYVMIHTPEGKFLKQKTMKYYEDHLNPNDFIRIHRSYIVKLTEIKQIELFEKESYRVILKDGRNLPVSKTGYVKIKEIFN